MMTNRRKVVVTGLGVVSCLGLEVEQNWEQLLAGVSGIRFLDVEAAEASAVKIGGAVAGDDLRRIREEFPEEAAMEGERRTLFSLWAAKSALTDAKFSRDTGQRERCGVAFASGLAINRLEDIASWISKDKKFDMARFSREYDPCSP